jgi:predicted P-loop ATPase
MLKEALRLREYGFAIHLLHPKSKAPIENGWSKAKPKTGKELAAQFRQGMNIGVRLGKASALGGGYLAVIDCDVKSTEARHTEELQNYLDTVFGDKFVTSPTVLSGRGGGSKHIYILTKEPVVPKRITQSSETVKVSMPSAMKTSKRENEQLTPEEIKKGIRLRPAWEISLMGEGQQVVLPPSIHPDSGKPYVWEIGLEKLKILELPFIAAKEKERDYASTKEDFRAEDVDLVLEGVHPKVIRLIEDGEGSDDRSASLFSAAMSMKRAGLTDNQIMTVLTDTRYYLGCAAYEHAQTQSRKRAAEWIRKYTLKKASRTVLDIAEFNAEVEVKELSEEEALEQEKEINAGPWENDIERVQGKPENPPKTTLKNIILILENVCEENPIRRDEFAVRDFYAVSTPWGGKEGDAIVDQDTVNIKVWLAEKYRLEPPRNMVSEALMFLAGKNTFHPVREYLRGIEWDGTPRISNWMKDYLGANAPEPYLSEVSRKTLCAMVARIFEPGCKFDSMPILEGVQDLGKSTVIKYLAGESWFSDTVADIRDKDAMLNLQGIWVIENGELATMKRADIDAFKAFVSKQVDKVRPPYGERWQEYKRQCIFFGTTNNKAYLRDRTGNRRFWPVEVYKADFKGIAKVRDQLLAEALFEWEVMGETLYLGGEAKEQAKTITSQKMHVDDRDVLEERIQKFFETEEKKDPCERTFDLYRFRLLDLFDDMGPLRGMENKGYMVNMVADILGGVGYKKVICRGKPYWRKQGGVESFLKNKSDTTPTPKWPQVAKNV